MINKTYNIWILSVNIVLGHFGTSNTFLCMQHQNMTEYEYMLFKRGPLIFIPRFVLHNRTISNYDRYSAKLSHVPKKIWPDLQLEYLCHKINTKLPPQKKQQSTHVNPNQLITAHAASLILTMHYYSIRHPRRRLFPTY